MPMPTKQVLRSLQELETQMQQSIEQRSKITVPSRSQFDTFHNFLELRERFLCDQYLGLAANALKQGNYEQGLEYLQTASQHNDLCFEYSSIRKGSQIKYYNEQEKNFSLIINNLQENEDPGEAFIALNHKFPQIKDPPITPQVIIAHKEGWDFRMQELSLVDEVHHGLNRWFQIIRSNLSSDLNGLKECTKNLVAAHSKLAEFYLEHDQPLNAINSYNNALGHIKQCRDREQAYYYYESPRNPRLKGYQQDIELYQNKIDEIKAAQRNYSAPRLQR